MILTGSELGRSLLSATFDAFIAASDEGVVVSGWWRAVQTS